MGNGFPVTLPSAGVGESSSSVLVNQQSGQIYSGQDTDEKINTNSSCVISIVGSVPPKEGYSRVDGTIHFALA